MQRLSPSLRGWRGLFSLTILISLVATSLVACGGNDDTEDARPTVATDGTVSVSPTTQTSPAAVPVKGDITVYAAASLTEAFTEAGNQFSKRYPEAKVTFQFAASSALATQINEGAPADVFASADEAQMKNVTDKANATSPRIFAKNQPVVVVPKNSTLVTSFNDLAKPGVKLVLAAANVPIGRYSREILTKASAASGGISPDFSDKALANLKSDEANVRAVLTKVQLGEADAGIVYVTDIGAAANDVRQITIPANYNVVATYPMAVTKATKDSVTAQAFVDYILSAEGQAILKKYGFAPPTP